MTAAELAAAAPGLDWSAFLRGAGMAGQAKLNVGQPSALTGTAALVASEPLETWQDYLRLRTIQRYASVLPKAFVDANFDFYGKSLPERRSFRSGGSGRQFGQRRGRRGGRAALRRPLFPARGQGQGRPAGAQPHRRDGQELANLTWMAPETKVKARPKLAAFNPMIGYPEKWTDYTPLQIVRGDAFGNLRRVGAFRLSDGAVEARQAGRPQRVVHEPADRQRLCQSGAEPDRLPGRAPAAALLRPGRRRRRELRRRSGSASATRSATISTTRAASSTRPASSRTGGRRPMSSASSSCPRRWRRSIANMSRCPASRSTASRRWARISPTWRGWRSPTMPTRSRSAESRRRSSAASPGTSASSSASRRSGAPNIASRYSSSS